MAVHPEEEDIIQNGEDTIDEENEGVSDEEFEKETEETAEKVIAALFDNDFRIHIDTLQADIQKLATPVDFALSSRLLFDSIETRSNPLAHELCHVVESPLPIPYPNIASLKQEVVSQRARIGTQQRDNRARARRTALAAFVGMAVKGELAPYLLFRVDDYGNPKPEGRFTSSDAEKAKAMLQPWRDLPDGKMWENLAAYADKHHPSFQAQMMMMGYIKIWAPGSKFEWTESDKVRVIHILQEGLHAQRQISALYRTVKGVAYQNNPLPRGVAADCCELMLAHLLARREAAKRPRGTQK